MVIESNGMHTLLILAVGVATLCLALGLAHLTGSRTHVMTGFLVVWAIAAAFNSYRGVQLGHPASVELIVFLVTFLLPAGIAWSLRK
jgi:hypothetical protein